MKIDSNLLHSAYKELRRNRIRSLLTCMGIAIGIASIIAAVSLSNSAKKQVEQQLLSMGGKSLIIKKGSRTKSGISSRKKTIEFTEKDIESIRKLDTIEFVTVITDITEYVIYGNRQRFTQLLGTSFDFFYINDWFAREGKIFSEEDIKNSELVCVLGNTVASDLFGFQDPIGRKIRIANNYFTVIGVLNQIGQTGSGRDQDDIVIVPYTTLQKRVIGKNLIGGISVSVRKLSDITYTENQIEELFMENHNISNSLDKGFQIKSRLNLMNTIVEVSNTMTVLIGVIASISIIVGGVGIMNIMLVSVTERTKEIGIRIAVGAKQKDILIQFISESVVLSLIGGVIGILFGVILSLIPTIFFNWPLSVSILVILLSFIFSASVGIFFGYYPAKKASSLNPIEALRS